MSDDTSDVCWKTYFARVNDAPVSIRADVRAATAARVAASPWLLYAFVEMRAARPDGLSTDEESPVLWKLEDALGALVEAELGGRLVGVITTLGRREFYYYACSAQDFAAVVRRALAPFPGYAAETGSQRDEAWKQYHDVLEPSGAQLQAMKDAELLARLAELGDRSEIERAVRHYAYFASAAARETYWTAIARRGYRRIARPPDADAESFGLVFESWQRADRDSVRDRTSELFELAAELGGEYDRWETSVERGE